MKKRVISVVAVLVVLAACVVWMVACAGEKLDGKYIEVGQENWYLIIEGNSIKYMMQNVDKSEDVISQGTFTIDGNKINITGFNFSLKSVIIDKEKQHIIFEYETGQKTTFTKQRTNK